jgi:hypothetical protein
MRWTLKEGQVRLSLAIHLQAAEVSNGNPDGGRTSRGPTVNSVILVGRLALRLSSATARRPLQGLHVRLTRPW